MVTRAGGAPSAVLAAILLAACGGGRDTASGAHDDASVVCEDPDITVIEVSFDLAPPADPDADPGPDPDADPDAGPAPGGFLAPCLDNADCNSGFCVESPEGSVCTRGCDTSCPEGWRCSGVDSPSGDVAFICVPLQSRLCLPCTTDLQCAGGYCLTDINGQRTCSRACGDGDTCPDGFLCEDKTSEESDARASRQCVPATGGCDCTARNAGELRPCPKENEHGRCWGAQVCDAATGWTACDAVTPGPELCDGVDQNCNGVVDEDATPPEAPCAVTNDAGTCGGSWNCAGPDGWRCDAQTPLEERCNYLDDNCDGPADEIFRDAFTGLYLDPDHCGLCNNRCAGRIPFATATTCAIEGDEPSCVATACESGYFIPDETRKACVPLGAGFPCSPCFGDLNCTDLPDGRCERLDGGSFCTRGCATDADCGVGGDYACTEGRCRPRSGSCTCLASNAGNVRTCRNQAAAGVCFGSQTCDPAAGWSDCSAATPSEEACNGLDDDCDGAVDEALARVPATCGESNTFGTCSAPWLCRGLAGWQCVDRTPAAEACNGDDDDCDGEVDEDFVDAATGLYTALEHCGACGVSCVGAIPNATARCGVSPSGRARCEVASCDAGFLQEGPLACVSTSVDTCVACASDASCAGGACAALPDGDFCLPPCTTDANCPERFSCETLAGRSLCVPDTGSCRCDGSDTSLLKGCAATFDPPGADVSYRCLGTQSCTATGWGMCQLPQEDCNLLDDDCDGQVDEDFLVDGAFATDENCGQCGNDCTLLDFPGGGGVCNLSVSPPRCSLRCGANCFDLNVNPNDGCECCDPTPFDFPDAAGRDANCDGIDGERTNGVFVARWGRDTNSGDFGAPKLTIQAGLEAARTRGRRDVYVATGIYREAVTLVPNVGLYGGYAADFVRRDAALFETVILGPAATPTKPAAVNAIGVSGRTPGATVLDGFSVYGVDALTPGASSFALWLEDCDASVRVSGNQLFAGRGGRGTRGLDGSDGADAPGGANGLLAVDVIQHFNLATGDQTCRDNLHTRAGGAAGAQQCGGVQTSGGGGGNRTCPAWNATTNETLAPPASSRGGLGQNGGGAGGTAGRDVYHQRFSCEGYDTYGPVEGLDGQDGPWGTEGSSGAACRDAGGRVVGGRWVVGTAGDGAVGGHAGGGGGGGSGGGAWVHNSCFAKGLNDDNLGGTGGGGGAGGCGGTAGRAGTSGGGAFGLVALFTRAPTTLPTIAENLIFGGFGGVGGDGGNGGVGGSGGAGGFGGAGGGSYTPGVLVEPSYPAFKGGKGGKGGNGGHGGGGGGGCGGPAFGIYASGQGGLSLARWRDDNDFPTPGTGGSGGLGGYSLGQAGGNGSAGTGAATNF
jgi:hypothetical protein